MNDETEAANNLKARKDHEEAGRENFGPWVLVTQKRKPKIISNKEKKPLAQIGKPSQSPSHPSHASSPSTGPVLPGLRSNKKKHTSSELTGDNGMSADRTKRYPSFDKSTAKQ